MIKKLFVIILLLIPSMFLASYLVYEKAFGANVEDFSDYYAVTFPEGTYFSVILQEPIDTSINKQDDLIEAIIPADYYLDQLLIIPKGSRVIGRIVYLERAHMGRNTLVNIRFVAMISSNNAWETRIDASIVDKNSDGSIGGQLTNRTKVKVIVHNIERIGPIGQGVPTGPREMGKEIYIPPGERWVIKLNEPARFVIPK